jgi:hypothetical protein
MGAQDRGMSDDPVKLSREARLAAQLRANLHRRKAQARALEAGGGDGAGDVPNAALPKTSPER